MSLHMSGHPGSAREGFRIREKQTQIQASMTVPNWATRAWRPCVLAYNGRFRGERLSPEKILVVDDEEAIREVVSTMLQAQGFECAAVGNGRIALDYLQKNSIDLVLSDMVMPEMDGLKLLEWLRTHDPDVPVIMVTAMHDAETEGHCQRVTVFTISIARAMEVPQEVMPSIARAAFLHDIGKMAIPDSILRKPGPLTDDEKQVMRRHCEIGYNMVTRIPFLRDAAEIVLSHQEFFNGTGYPRGLRGEEIPLGARIFAVADALDAMISDRPYRRALPLSHARNEIRRCSGTQFDPDVVEVFLSLPESLWIELRENLGAPFRLSQLKVG